MWGVLHVVAACCNSDGAIKNTTVTIVRDCGRADDCAPLFLLRKCLPAAVALGSSITAIARLLRYTSGSSMTIFGKREGTVSVQLWHLVESIVGCLAAAPSKYCKDCILRAPMLCLL